MTFYRRFERFSTFGNAFIRFPLRENEIGYKFGREYEAHLGAEYPLRCWKRVSLLLSLDYLYAEHDRAYEGSLPARLLDGVKVLNTGGSFLDLTPGFSVTTKKNFTFVARVFLPMHQDWNGDRATGVG